MSKKMDKPEKENVLKLSNGDTLTFVEHLKGKHHLAMQKTIAKAMKSKPIINKDGTIGGSVEIDEVEYQQQVVNFFPAVVESIIDKDGKEVQPSVEYYMEADFDDAKNIYSKVVTIIRGGMIKKN